MIFRAFFLNVHTNLVWNSTFSHFVKKELMVTTFKRSTKWLLTFVMWWTQLIHFIRNILRLICRDQKFNFYAEPLEYLTAG